MFEDPTPVRRCVCAWVTFAEMKDAEVASLEEAADRFQAGVTCGTCCPYIELMLKTGQTAFPVL